MYGKRIKEIRKERRMSQSDLADKVGVGTSQISMIEAGKRTTSVERLMDIANALNVDIVELYDDDSKEKVTFSDGKEGWALFNEEMKERGYTPEELKKWIEIVENLRKDNE